MAAGALPTGTGAMEVVETTHGQSPYGLLRWKTIVVLFGAVMPGNGPPFAWLKPFRYLK